MTNEERKECERFIDEGTLRQHTGVSVYALIESYDAAIALARRVYAECGSECLDNGKTWKCKTCRTEVWETVLGPITAADLEHNPDCLWLAAEAVLKGAGAI